jgi:hypothetical protein
LNVKKAFLDHFLMRGRNWNWATLQDFWFKLPIF